MPSPAYKIISLHPANDFKHKYVVALHNLATGRTLHVKFGSYGMSDYTIHRDKARRELYLQRHSGKGEDLTNPATKGFWSAHLLWGQSTSFKVNLNTLVKRFKL